MGHDPLLEALASDTRLLGAAVALGAEKVGGVSLAEERLVDGLEVIRPAPSEMRELKRRIKEGDDPLGQAFCLMRTAVERRADGATYTPSSIIAPMIRWAANGPTPERIVDPGSGSARFAVAAGKEFRRAAITCVELDPLAAMLGRANLAVSGMARRSRIVVEDFRRFRPEPGKSAGRTLYIGNPPYVRHHQISPGWKRWLTQTAREHGHEASQLAGLHVYFFLAAATVAKPGDRGVFITAAEWLDVNYGSLVRSLVLNGLGGEAIHVIEPTAKPFEDADATGAILCFEIGAKPQSLRLRRAKTTADLRDLNSGQGISRQRLAEARRWTPLTRALRKVPSGYIELGELCRVHRGAVTGANRVFVIDERSGELPADVLFPAVTRAKELFAAGAVLKANAPLRRVVDIPPDLDAFDTQDRKLIDRFLKRARTLGAHEGYVARHRNAWWSVGLRTPAPILATYMARRPPAIVRNAADARHINVAHGLYPRDRMSATVLDRLAQALRSSITVGEGRTYAGGLTKFEPREMERLLIPDVTAVARPA